MKGSKLLTLWQSLKPEQRPRFMEWVGASFVNDNPYLVKLAKLLHNSLFSSHSKDSFLKERIWQKVFGNETYNDAKLRRYFSDLLRHLEDFLIFEQSTYSSEYLQKLLVIYNREGFEKHFRAAYERWITSQTSKAESRQSLFENYLINNELFVFEERAKGNNSTQWEHFDKANTYLDAYYYCQKLKQYCEVLGYQSFKKTQLEYSTDFMVKLQSHPVLQFTLVRAYYLTAQMFSFPDNESYYSELKEVLTHYHSAISPEELNILYTHLRNYCITKKINQGREDYYQELFGIYQSQLTLGLLFNNNLLNPQVYKNIITLSLRVNDFEFAENFIKDYTQKLPEKDQANALSYNLAYVYFYQKKYGKVIEQLREVEYQNLSYALGGKLLLLRTYYEIDELDALESLLDSFRIYLIRNKLIPKETQQQYIKIINFVRQLIYLNPVNKQAVLKLKQKISASNDSVAKSWLLEKVDAIRRV